MIHAHRLCTLGRTSPLTTARSASSRRGGQPGTRRVSTARIRCHERRVRFLQGRERGKFYKPDATFTPPVHLDPEVLAFLTARAKARGISLSDLVNALLKKDIELIEAAE